MQEQARVVIIGAAIVGCSVAYHLTKMGWRDIVVLEQGGRLFDTGGSTSHTPGLIFENNPSRMMTELAKYSVELYKQLELDGKPCFAQVGGMEVAWTKERWEYLKWRAGYGKSWGLEPELISAKEAREKIPILTDKIYGAMYVPTDGDVNAIRATEAMGTIAQGLGATFYPRTQVTDIEVKDGRVQGVITNRGRIRTEIVIAAGGIWGPRIGRMAGVTIPLYPMEHLYVETGPLPELAGETEETSHPILRHQDRSMYFRQWGDRYAFGSYRHEPIPIEPEDILSHEEARDTPAIRGFSPKYGQEAIKSAVELIPCLGNAELMYSMGGMFSFTPDGMSILGESPDVRGFWSAQAVWVAHAGGVGKVIAEWLTDGTPSLDLHEGDISRFHPHVANRSYIKARSCQQYREVYDIIHPLQQMGHPRNLRLSPFHPRQKELGAEFFETVGWERPQWYNANEKLLDGRDWPKRSGWEARFWSPIIAAEHQATRERVALFDLTAFSKFEVDGPKALEFLQYITTNQMDQPVGKITYTSMVNKDGGIKCDLTITRLGDDRFRIVTGGSTKIHDLAWIRSHLPADGSVRISDVSSSECCLGVWGPRARELVQSVSENDLSNDAFPYLIAQHITIGEIPVLALRISYAGELGWEVYTPTEYGLKLWDTLWQAGQSLGVVAAGGGAFDALRLEKGYRLWGSDIHTEHNPYEAGIGFAVKLKKGDFLGREALERVKAEGIKHKLCCLTLDDPNAVVIGKEPILDGRRVLGYVTSANYGYTIGRCIVYGYLPVEYATEGTKVEVEYFGKRYKATVSKEPLYDPTMEKLKS